MERATARVGANVLKKQLEVVLSGGDRGTIEQRLVYLGQSGSSFKLGYREYGDQGAREPFYEDVVYQNPPDGGSVEIAFRRALFRVYSVSNVAIEFETLDDPRQI